MKTRKLPSQERIAELLDYNPETGVLTWKPRGIPHIDAKCAGKEAFTAKTPKGYRRGMIDGVQYRAHRVIYKLVHNEEPDEIDHINGIRDDNRISNLRASNRRENLLNTAASKAKASVGENYIRQLNSGTWTASISLNYKRLTLGTYATKEEARAAANGALLLLSKM